MAYTTNNLIADAFYASGVASREFETVTGQQISDGLQWLNNIITEKVVDESMIPYESIYSASFVIGQEVYSIPNMISIDTLVFYKNSVRFQMKYTKRNAYFGSNRVENIQSLPYSWFWERQLGGGNLYIYFEPDQAYPFEVHGVMRLSEVTLGQDLSLTLEQFYTTYLRYALADRICAEYALDSPPRVMAQLDKYQAFISKKSRILDLSINKSSTLQNNVGLSWSFVNLGRGFVAPY